MCYLGDQKVFSFFLKSKMQTTKAAHCMNSHSHEQQLFISHFNNKEKRMNSKQHITKRTSPPPPEISKSAGAFNVWPSSEEGACSGVSSGRPRETSVMSHLGDRGMSERVCFLPDVSVLYHFTLYWVIFWGQMSVPLVVGRQGVRKETHL